MLLSNYALKFVDYPTQVIAKSCKPIPGTPRSRARRLIECAVMISGLFINRKRYPLSKYVLITLVAVGISLFMYNPHVRLPPLRPTRLSNSHGLSGG